MIYKDCYEENVLTNFDHSKNGLVSCEKKGYYITGLYRSQCNLLHCITEFMCCSMLPALEGEKFYKNNLHTDFIGIIREEIIGCMDLVRF